MTHFNQYIISESASIKDALIALNNNSGGILTLFVVDTDDRMVGSLSDGDIRRGLISGAQLSDSISTVMLRTFKHISDKKREVTTIKEYKEQGIGLLPYLDKQGKIEKVYALKHLESILPVDAVLMAGGKGERLRPLTEKTPKPLLKIGDQTIIDRNVDRLISNGIENIYVTTNYLGQQIEDHFREPRHGTQIHCVREKTFLGTMGAVRNVVDFDNDTVLIMNSDLFTNINLQDFYLHFKESNADLSIAAVPYSVSIPYGIFDLEEDHVTGIREKPQYTYYANAGIYLIRRELIRYIPKDKVFGADDLIEKLISEQLNVVRFPLLGYWIDIGKPEDFKKAQEFAKHL
ncbi:MAG: nucleotidyltransferase family protein [Dysgonamonadaceae bacterium]